MKDFLRAWNPDDEGTVEYHEFRVWCPGADDEGKEIIARNAKEAAESWAELFDLDGIGGQRVTLSVRVCVEDGTVLLCGEKQLVHVRGEDGVLSSFNVFGKCPLRYFAESVEVEP